MWRAPEVLLPASGEEEAKERRVQRRDLPLCWLDDTQVISHKPKTVTFLHGLHCKKSFSIFLSPAGMSLTKLSMGANYDVIYKLFLLKESLVSDIPAGDGNIETFFTVC
jgi:hypothetical protein